MGLGSRAFNSAIIAGSVTFMLTAGMALPPELIRLDDEHRNKRLMQQKRPRKKRGR